MPFDCPLGKLSEKYTKEEFGFPANSMPLYATAGQRWFDVVYVRAMMDPTIETIYGLGGW